jgi:hypothetical protein
MEEMAKKKQGYRYQNQTCQYCLNLKKIKPEKMKSPKGMPAWMNEDFICDIGKFPVRPQGICDLWEAEPSQPDCVITGPTKGQGYEGKPGMD